MDLQTIGNRIDAILRQKGIHKAEFGKNLGIGSYKIYNLLRGELIQRRGIPFPVTSEDFVEIANYLSCDLDELLDVRRLLINKPAIDPEEIFILLQGGKINEDTATAALNISKESLQIITGWGFFKVVVDLDRVHSNKFSPPFRGILFTEEEQGKVASTFQTPRFLVAAYDDFAHLPNAYDPHMPFNIAKERASLLNNKIGQECAWAQINF